MSVSTTPQSTRRTQPYPYSIPYIGGWMDEVVGEELKKMDA
jgi:hypothetical protein